MASKNKFAGLSDKERIKKLIEMSDEEIDYSDIPEVTDFTGWKRAYPNATKNTIITKEMMFDALARTFEENDEKLKVTMLLNRRVVDFFKKHNKKYQTKINDLLLEFVDQYERLHSH